MGARKNKKVSLKDVIEAIRKNGYTQATGWLFKHSNDDAVYLDYLEIDEPIKFWSACALGQAAVNLGVDALALQDKLSKYDWLNGYGNASQIVINMNDVDRAKPEEIAAYLEENLPKRLEDASFLVPIRKYIYVGKPVSLKKAATKEEYEW